MTTDPDFDIDAALDALRLQPSDLAALCGVSRVTIWKWRNGRLPIPAHARRILQQQRTIRALAVALAEDEGT